MPLEHHSLDDGRLLCRFREQGDREALSHLFERHRSLAYRVALGVLGDPTDAEDGAQNAFTKFLDYAGRARPESSLAGLVACMAIHSAQDMARASGRRRKYETQVALEEGASGDTVYEQIADEEERQSVRKAVAALDERYRLPVVLHYFEDLPTREVAQALGITQTAVTTRLSRAVAKLRDHFRRAGVVLTLAAIEALLRSLPTEAAPASLAIRLSRLADSAAVGSPAAVAAGAGGVALKGKLAAGGLAAIAVLAGIGVLSRLPAPPRAGATGSAWHPAEGRPGASGGRHAGGTAAEPGLAAVHPTSHTPVAAAPERRSRPPEQADDEERTPAAAARGLQGGTRASAGRVWVAQAGRRPTAPRKEQKMPQQPANPQAPARMVLEGFPRVGSYDGTRPPEETNFPSCLRGFLELQGDECGVKTQVNAGHPWHRIYVHLMGASGAAFRLLWNAERWDPASTNMFAMANDPVEPVRRAFEAAGYECQILLKRDYAGQLGITQERDYDEAAFRARIIDSVGKARPVIAIGVIGPPDCCVVTGYDQGGEVLTGWNYFQNDEGSKAGQTFEPNGYFRKRDWFNKTLGLILIGEKRGAPPVGETYRKALHYALDVMRTPQVRGLHSGHAAYRAWADALLEDASFSTENMQALRDQYLTHWLSGLVVAEGRAWAGVFLRQIADQEPAMAKDLEGAADCFSDEHDLMWAVWEFCGGNGFSDDHARKLARPDVRRRMAPLIRLAQEKDVRAGESIERALGAR